MDPQRWSRLHRPRVLPEAISSCSTCFEGTMGLADHRGRHCDPRQGHYSFRSQSQTNYARRKFRCSTFRLQCVERQPALNYEKATHFLPRDLNDPNTVRFNLFAPGSTLYELAYCNAPYGELYPQQPTSLDPDTYNSY
ncbi:uncharacterized protein A1O5_07409 [Cladophialophora psammophila CBS 110553]|uniref:Uncharacterized protein n=1 Tax=Cladophialophora psammophila CBS 110553 TaxID=1182543 RepID=W9WND3_9EURO|nr:uncharacterized protein A1O5_07409 [Cladophialophora psammophila CBS 110553]EXJ69373.1 hypothetical protein A1O5_07409 [Cladophialophora psammophila CBS 110553]